MSKPTVFDFINDMSFDKTDLIRQDETVSSGYNPYIVNKAFSFLPETVMYANEMNRRSDISKEQQYDYYRYSLSKRKRYITWYKSEKIDKINIVMEYFGYSHQKAKDALLILSDSDIEDMKEFLDKGGVK